MIETMKNEVEKPNDFTFSWVYIHIYTKKIGVNRAYLQWKATKKTIFFIYLYIGIYDRYENKYISILCVCFQFLFLGFTYCIKIYYIICAMKCNTVHNNKSLDIKTTKNYKYIYTTLCF
jgi:hypothetical protein